MMKFNQDMYANMRSKKNESLSNLGKRTVYITEKGPPVTSSALISPAIPGIETMRMASPATSIEVIPTPISKRPRLTDKEKVDSRPFSVWDDTGLAVERAYEVVTANYLKIFLGVPSNEIVAHYVQ